MSKELPNELVRQIQDIAGSPWWNCSAWAGYHGLPQRINELEAALDDLVTKVDMVRDELRQRKDYALADKLRAATDASARIRSLGKQYLDR